MTTIIGICGFIGSGKNTVAEILEKEYGFVPVSFAAVLKDMSSALFGWDREMLEGKTEYARKAREEVDPWWAKKLSIPNFSPRFALQYIGTDVMRDHFHENIWVISAERKIIMHDRVVLSDVRFPNEIRMIKNNCGAMWRVSRDPEPDLNNLHVSETAWIDAEFDRVIDNNGSLDDLFVNTREAIRKYIP